MHSCHKVIFLDFDGPLANWRTSMQRGAWHLFDPVAVQILGNMCEASGAKIVCLSSRTYGPSRASFRVTRALLEEGGLDISSLHEDWSCYPETDDKKEGIQRWLDRHAEVTHYCVVDDENVWSGENFVKVDEDNGILKKDFEAIARCLDFDIGLAFKEAVKRNGLNSRQQKLEFDFGDQHYNESLDRYP